MWKTGVRTENANPNSRRKNSLKKVITCSEVSICLLRANKGKNTIGRKTAKLKELKIISYFKLTLDGEARVSRKSGKGFNTTSQDRYLSDNS